MVPLTSTANWKYVNYMAFLVVWIILKVYLHVFLLFLQWNNCEFLLSPLNMKPLQIEDYSYRKEFAPIGANSFL